MHAALAVLIALLATIAVVSLVAPRIGAPAPVLLAVSGALIALVPGVPRLPLHPDLILVLFLPPILYADAFDTSWVDFRRWLRPIVMLAVGLVSATILVVGLVTKYFLPELPYPVCFLLGAIVSPTDTVAVQAVIERLRVPRRVTAIVGGESLVNDATGLVGVQIAVAVILSGTFDAGVVAIGFARVAGLGVVVGVAIGIAFSLVNRRVRDTHVLFVLSLLAPYLAFLIASQLEASGVLAVVVSGFIVSWRIHTVPAEARVPLYSAWDLLISVLNGICFVFIGLETPHWLRLLHPEQGESLLWAALAVSATVVLVRIVWCFPSAYLPLFLSPRVRAKEGGYPSWRGVTLVSWCGVRGVISLAAALALPLTLADGTPFPGRDEIIACTLAVILVTLVAQGLTLLPLVRALGMRDDEATEGEVRAARETVLTAGVARLDAFCSETSCPLAVYHWRTLMLDELASLRAEDTEERKLAGARLDVSAGVHRAVAEAQSAALLALRDRGTINDQTYMELQLELDRTNYRANTARPQLAHA